jgi:hypothetical protein
MWYAVYRHIPYPWTDPPWAGSGSPWPWPYDWARVVYWPWLS